MAWITCFDHKQINGRSASMLEELTLKKNKLENPLWCVLYKLFNQFTNILITPRISVEPTRPNVTESGLKTPCVMQVFLHLCFFFRKRNNWHYHDIYCKFYYPKFKCFLKHQQKQTGKTIYAFPHDNIELSVVSSLYSNTGHQPNFFNFFPGINNAKHTWYAYSSW